MDIIDEIIAAEGPETNDPDDPGGRTKFGIAERANPDAWTNGPPTYDAARALYQQRYIDGPGFNQLVFEPLRNQVIDYGVNAGTAVPIRALQRMLALPIDGVCGPVTQSAINHADGTLLNNQLVMQRIAFYRTLANIHPTDRKFLSGWLARARKFILP